MSVRDRIEAHLKQAGSAYDVIEHAYADTSETVAIARGTPLNWGGKSLVFKLGKKEDFAVFAINAHRAINSKAIRRFIGLSRLRFARPEELLELTGLKPGCVPPFGHPIFNLPLYVDASLPPQEDIAFSVGTHTASLTMKTAAYLAAAQPVAIFDFSEERK